MKVHTIGFTKKPAEQFFGLLWESGVKRIVDVRLHTGSTLSGFARDSHLPWLLKSVKNPEVLEKSPDIDYIHLPKLLAPTDKMLSAYRKKHIDWDGYESKFLDLMNERNIAEAISPDIIADSCLLCSEEKPDRCHRRLVAEYLQEKWGGMQIIHLV